MTCCTQVVAGQEWQVDVAVTCTKGGWDHGVQTIIVHGTVNVPAGGSLVANATVTSTALVSSSWLILWLEAAVI